MNASAHQLAGVQNKREDGVSRGLFQINLGNFFGMAGKPKWGMPVIMYSLAYSLKL